MFSLLHCRRIITEVLGGDIQFYFFYRWFDAIFVASSLLTLAFVAAHHAAKRNEKRLD